MLKYKVIQNRRENDTSDYMGVTEYTESDDEMAIAGDVFTTNENCLELAVGRADDIYCIVDIGGYYYLTRGSVFSYYEFTQPISKRLTDKEWRDMLNSDQVPPREGWYEDILLKKFEEKLNILNTNPSSLKEYHGKSSDNDNDN